MIGEEQEYARRLAVYLGRRLSADIHIHCFTDPGLLSVEEKADLYLLGEDFLEGLNGISPSFTGENLLVLGREEGSGDFCRLEGPAGLIPLIDAKLGYAVSVQDHPGEGSRLIAIYAPFSGLPLREWIRSELHPGDLYLGFQDMGSDAGTYDMSRLCYYIHLREEKVLKEMEGMLMRDEAGFYIDSPPWFFDFLGLTEEDYRWFFHLLREDSPYGKIYIGLGNTAVPSLEYFQEFDQVILLDLPHQEQIHAFCRRFVRAMTERRVLRPEGIEVRDYAEFRSRPAL